jgi:hypothetical protein
MRKQTHHLRKFDGQSASFFKSAISFFFFCANIYFQLKQPLLRLLFFGYSRLFCFFSQRPFSRDAYVPFVFVLLAFLVGGSLSLIL